MTPDFFIKTFSTLVPLGDTMLRLRANLRQTRAWWKSAETAVGRLGRPYHWIWKYPVRLEAAILLLILLCLTVALAGGVYSMARIGTATDQAKELSDIRASPIWGMIMRVHDQTWLILGTYILLAIAVAYHALPRLARNCTAVVARWNRAVRFSPGFINADWQCEYDDRANAVNIEREACLRTANAIADLIGSGTKWRANRAEPTAAVWSLDVQDRANALLIANTIEGAIHENHLGKMPWQRFYEVIADIAARPERPLSWVSLRKDPSGNSVYRSMRECAGNDLNLFPSSTAIATEVARAVRLLLERHQGNAAYLAGTSSPSVTRALRSLQQYPQMGYNKPKCMGPQFVKLCVRWKVWPSIKTGPLIYASDSVMWMPDSLLGLLLDSGCIVVANPGNGVPNDENMKRLAVRTLHEISVHFGGLLKDSGNTELALLQAQFSEGGADPEFALYEIVDYILWSRSRERTDEGDSILSPPRIWEVGNQTIRRL